MSGDGAAWRTRLGRVGVWSGALRYGDRAPALDASAELEDLGYGALWIPGGIGGDVFDACGAVLDATRRVVVATGIVNLWMHAASETAAAHHQLTGEHPGRFLLGLGVSHAPLVDAADAGRYRHPLAATERYLDELDAAEPPVPATERVLAALGPRMLALAAARTAGAHPYLVTPEHTAWARAALGRHAVLAPEQHVVLEEDPAIARDAARSQLAIYLGLPNYVNSWRRLGFDEQDVAPPGSDRLVDAVVVWGDEATIACRVREHLDAGADHVCVQVAAADLRALPRDAWRRLAPALRS